MSEQIPTPESGTTPPPPAPPPPPPGDWREQRRAERMAHRAERKAHYEARRQQRGSRPYGGWLGGFILLLIGLYFLLQNLGVQVFTNWWAIFILVPAFWSFVAAWNIYRDHDRFTRGVASSLVIGLLLTILAVIFLLNLAIGLFWPILLIIGGLALLVSAFFPR